MSWIQRGPHTYYYRSVRHGGRVTKEYLGTGPLAELAAAADVEQREERDAARAVWRQERADLEALDQQLDAWWNASRVLLTATLYTEGYYQHDRGEWRKRADREGDGPTPREGEQGG